MKEYETTKTTGTAVLERPEVHPDPLTDESGAHPVGTGVGAASGGTVGALAGAAVGGPVGAMVGAAVGGIAGGMAGKGIAESVNPTEQDAYWRDHYTTRPYASGRTYEELQPAYRYGWESRVSQAGSKWNEVETELERGWDKAKAETKLGWHEAKDAVRDGWHYVERALPGDADGDGR